jgi:hypothetical protein
VSFVFSGVTWAACVDLPVGPADMPATAHSMHLAADADHSVHGHHHGADGKVAVASEQPSHQGHGFTHAVKCCSMVPAFDLSPALLATPVTFSGAVIAFSTARRDLTGFVAALDPGIPKTIA